MCRPFQVLPGGSINIITRLSCSPAAVTLKYEAEIPHTWTEFIKVCKSVLYVHYVLASKLHLTANLAERVRKQTLANIECMHDTEAEQSKL